MKTLDKMLFLFWDLVFFIMSLLGIFAEGMLIFFINVFLKGISRRNAMRMLSDFSRFLERAHISLKSHIDKSCAFRRIISLLFVIILFLHFCPIQTFGRWKLYERGVASYYGWGFYCRATASGEIYWPWKYAAAHKSLPLGEFVKVLNLDNGRVIYVRIFDRGPFVKGRIIDLTKRAARDLGIVENGLARVEIYVKE